MLLWSELCDAQRTSLQATAASLGLGLVPVTPPHARQLALDDAFIAGQRFRLGTLWFDPAVATVEDLTHDLGHALALSPGQRAAFEQPEGDIDTGEPAALLGQWAIARAALPGYDLPASLEDFGYSFGYEDHSWDVLSGRRWAAYLADGRVVRAEAAMYCHLRAVGLIQASPSLRPTQHRGDWEPLSEWRPSWAEAAYAGEIQALTAQRTYGALPRGI